MSQPKVSDFFSSKKGSSTFQPSKRRKLDNPSHVSTPSELSLIASPPLASRTRSRKSAVPAPNQNSYQQSKKAKVNHRKKKLVCVDPNQSKISDVLSSKQIGEVTAASDDHNASPPCSPSKKKKDDDTVQPKRIRHPKPSDLLQALEQFPKTPDRAFDFAKFIEKDSVSARKKLILKSPSSSANDNSSEKEHEQQVGKKKETKSQPSEKQKQAEKNVQEESIKPSSTALPVVDVSANKLSLSSKSQANQKARTAASAGALRAKLAESGKLAEVQAKLREFNAAKTRPLSPVKQARPRVLAEEAAKSKSSKAPAHERFHSLAEAVPPSLTLPLKYKLLAELFRGVDTVVSMLHKRAETCTFAKLQQAVQKLVRRNFEERNLGQLKTVYPKAYTYRQEKGLPTLTGGKHNTYQLTVDANLEPVAGQKAEKMQLDKHGRPVFTASHLTERCSTFHSLLVAIVKKYHREFLTALGKPLSVDDAKLQRWHPQFKLDSLPDIDAAPLPQRPDGNRITSVSEVLETAKASLNPRIQRALKLAAGQVSPRKETSSSGGQSSSADSAGRLSAPTPASKQLSGVSQSLLDRIRAKEAAKTEASMLRSGEDEARLKRIERLPELARILRTVFVTQKKPALLLDDVINKLGESYKSNMGRAECEAHVSLLVELVPDWLQVVQIKRGRFVKMDKNKDMNAIQERLAKMFKQAK